MCIWPVVFLWGISWDFPNASVDLVTFGFLNWGYPLLMDGSFRGTSDIKTDDNYNHPNMLGNLHIFFQNKRCEESKASEAAFIAFGLGSWISINSVRAAQELVLLDTGFGFSKSFAIDH